MPVYAVGDIQGCRNEFDRLLDKLEFDPQRDRLWLTGDLVNRGDDSLGVLRRVRALGDACITVLGNHDLHLLAVAGGAVRSKKKDTLDELLRAADGGELIDWLRHRPTLHYDAGLNAALVHAGLAAQWTLADALALAGEIETELRGPRWPHFAARLYGKAPVKWRKGLTDTARIRFIAGVLTRIRYCDRKGRVDFGSKGVPGTQPAGVLPWFDVPARKTRGVRVIFGHWSTLGLLIRPDIVALDTGCVWGGALTAVRLDGADESVAVQCRKLQVPGS